MRIAMLAPIAWRTPPRHYGPWELVSSLLTEELVKLGHEVTLFATADSQTRAQLDALVPAGYEEDKSYNVKVMECLHIAHCMEQAAQFDLIHNQFDFLPLSYSRLIKTPVVTTIHGFSSDQILPAYQQYNGHAHYISISYADRHPLLTYAANIYHGINLSDFELCTHPDKDCLVYMGRMHPDKGAHEAIEIARKSGKKLMMAGIVQDTAYFNDKVKPHIDGEQIQYIGTVDPEQRKRLLGNAAAMLHPIGFAEPFGLSVIESMACGTPVIAYEKGSMSELIENGRNGFLARNAEEATNAVTALKDVDRTYCRKIVEEKYTAGVMAKGYEAVYEKILSGQK